MKTKFIIICMAYLFFGVGIGLYLGSAIEISSDTAYLIYIVSFAIVSVIGFTIVQDLRYFITEKDKKDLDK